MPTLGKPTRPQSARRRSSKAVVAGLAGAAEFVLAGAWWTGVGEVLIAAAATAAAGDDLLVAGEAKSWMSSFVSSS